MATWVNGSASGFTPKDPCDAESEVFRYNDGHRLLVSQDRDEIYLTFAKPGTGYAEYLKTGVDSLHQHFKTMLSNSVSTQIPDGQITRSLFHTSLDLHTKNADIRPTSPEINAWVFVILNSGAR
ncbi:hypothetical protein ASPWEDRAFT_30320 [Aspergillus wentii DTO 134E9]|uniref:Uncharacterized protein n=1 Tax=Aspergillus wentii DTO 134E9 TaxID=1073089 RepID=A0A1L9RE55_ASPWE|nr:uncharacterized protein ASPWEDRAFT_30320 [Aspergillus wentii DTO 134E9]OJJ33219.1 hypothetical protein ASPWEDRAFT_30320 [Aspergillus wentii DTO 134E9]